MGGIEPNPHEVVGDLHTNGVRQGLVPSGERILVELLVVHPQNGDERLAPAGCERIFGGGEIRCLAHKYRLSGTSYAPELPQATCFLPQTYHRSPKPYQLSGGCRVASCPLSCRSLQRMRMCLVSLTYPYPLHTFPLIRITLPPALTMTTATSSACTIPISGMHCAGCSSRVQQALESTPGVSAATVNLMTNSATVDFDPSAVTPTRLVAAIRETGYGAELPAARVSTTELVDQQDAARAAEIRELRQKFSVSLGAAILAMLLSLPLASADLATTHDPLMRVMMPLSRMFERIVPGLAEV